MATQQEVMKAFMKSLDETELSGRAALDEAVKASSNFKSYREVIDKFIDDRKAAGDNWHRFLVEKCGIVLNNKDTGAISGSDAGGSTAKGAEDIIPATGTAKYPKGTSFTVDGLTIYGIPPKEELTKDQQYIVRGLYSWWLRDALALIKESYGLSFDEEGTTNARMKLEFYEADNGVLASVVGTSKDGKDYESRVLRVNMNYFKNMSWDNRHASAPATDQALDRTLVHELTHGIMCSNVNYFNDLPLPIVEGATAELIHGIDDEFYPVIIECTKDNESFTKLKDYLDPSSAGKDMGIMPYAGGYIFMRYFLKQAADTTFDYDTYHAKVSTDSSNFATNYFDKVTMSGSKATDTITNSGSKVSISALDGADLVINYSTKVTITSGAGADKINNEGTKTIINADTGNDYIYNNSTALNASIFGGKGNDTIINLAEKSYVSGDAGKDFISNVGKKASIQGGTGNDSVLNGQLPEGFGSVDESLASVMGMNSTIHGGDGIDLLYNYGESVFIYGDGGNDLIINGSDENNTIATSSKLYGGDGDDSITNYAVKSFVSASLGNDQIENSGASSTLNGGADNDSIQNEGDASKIYGAAGNDSIWNSGKNSTLSGGAGNDSIKNTGYSSSLYGGAGNDSLVNRGEGVYIVGGSGDDSIYNSGAEITIFGGAGNDSLYNEGSDVYFSGGKGNDTIRNYGDHITVSGGSGNDAIINSGGKHITYNFGKSYGNDTVVGFNANDTVQITSGKYSAKTSGKNVIVNVGNSSLTLKNAVGKAINFISSSGKTSTKTFSASSNANVAELWFAAEDNFTTANNLGSIVKSETSSIMYDKIETTSLESFASKGNLITYGK